MSDMTLGKACKILGAVEHMDTPIWVVVAGHLECRRANATHVLWKEEALSLADKYLEEIRKMNLPNAAEIEASFDEPDPPQPPA